MSREQTRIRAISHRVDAVGGVNLGQGKCPLPPDPRVVQAAHRAIDAGLHTATLHDGLPRLRRAVAEYTRRWKGLEVGPDHVLISAGATGGLVSAFGALVHPGDEVLTFSPVFPYHVRFAEQRGARVNYLPLGLDGRLTEEALEGAVTPATRLLVFSNPNNPTGRVFDLEELGAVARVAQRHDLTVVVDEVYEHFTRAEHPHRCLAALPGMFERTVTVGSASKTLHVTGWRVGWALGPRALIGPMGVISDEVYLCAPAPLQLAVSEALEAMGPPEWGAIRAAMNRRADRLVEALCAAGLPARAPEGGYFVLADYRSLGAETDDAAVDQLLGRIRVGAVPGGAFDPQGRDQGWLRFSCALPDDVLDRGIAALLSLRL